MNVIELITGDSLEVLPTLDAESFGVVMTSPPYNLGIKYRSGCDDSRSRSDYLIWTRSWLSQVRRVLAKDGSLFLNLGGKPSDPWGPFDVAALCFRSAGLQFQNLFHWVKSASWDGGPVEGHAKPINSPRFVTDCAELVFHLTKTGAVPLDRLAVGVPFADECLSVETRVVARIDNEIRVTRLSRIKSAFDQGSCVELPSWDFNTQEPVWTKVISVSEPRKQEVLRVRTKRIGQVWASTTHRFPVLKQNSKASKEAMSCLPVAEIAARQKRWKSKPVSIYATPSLASLVSSSTSPLLGRDTGYALGLFLAEGNLGQRETVWFAGHVKETDDPEFGGFLKRYFKDYFGAEVNTYPSQTTLGTSFHASCAIFRTIVKRFVRGKDALTKALNLNECVSAGSDFIRGIVDGFLKGDGSYRDDYKRFEVGICNNKRLMEDLRIACLLIGYEFREQKPSDVFSFGAFRRRLNFMIRKSVFGGKRTKRENGLSAERLWPIERGGRGDREELLTLDVQVEVKHSLFFLANGIMTHNSNLTRGTRGKNGNKRCRGNVVVCAYETIQSRDKDRPHPASYPPTLAEHFIRLHGLSRTKKVLDPFSGLASTARACQKLGVDCVGIELSAEDNADARRLLAEDARA